MARVNLAQWLALPGFDRSLRIIVVCMVGLAGYALILLLLACVLIYERPVGITTTCRIRGKSNTKTVR